MKELFTEEQAGQIVLFLSIAVFVISLGSGFYLGRKAPPGQKKLLWANSLISALFGPVIWVFWQYIYNPIEDYYGLDSLKALKINFFIAVGFGVIFVVLTFLASRWIGKTQASKRRK
jgi:hypothetical protein